MKRDSAKMVLCNLKSLSRAVNMFACLDSNASYEVKIEA